MAYWQLNVRIIFIIEIVLDRIQSYPLMAEAGERRTTNTDFHKKKLPVDNRRKYY